MLSQTQFADLREKLSSEGGFSVSRGGAPPTGGVMVARTGSEEVVPGVADAASISAFAEKHDAELGRDRAFLGGWVDDGSTYLDVSQSFPPGPQADNAMVANNQLAGFDVAAGDEVTPPQRNTLFPLRPDVDPVWQSSIRRPVTTRSGYQQSLF